MQTAVKERPQALTQEWSDWHWQNNKIIRHQRQDWSIQEECDDHAYLEKHLRVLRQLKQELLNRAAASQGSRREDFEEVRFDDSPLLTISLPKQAREQCDFQQGYAGSHRSVFY